MPVSWQTETKIQCVVPSLVGQSSKTVKYGLRILTSWFHSHVSIAWCMHAIYQSV